MIGQRIVEVAEHYTYSSTICCEDGKGLLDIELL